MHLQAGAYAPGFMLALASQARDLLPATEIQAQRRVRQMRVIVLRPWTYYRAFVVVVVLITDIPIKPMMQLDGQPRLRRLITHWIRCDQGSGVAGRIRHSIALSIIFIDSIGGKQRRSRGDSGYRLDKEEVIPHDVQIVSQRMPNAVKEIVDYRLTVYPLVVVAGAQRGSRGRGPIK